MDLYDNTLRLQLPPIADYPAVKLTTRDVPDWYKDLKTYRDWLDKKNTGLASGTARDQLRRLRSAYRWAINKDIVLKSPLVIQKLGEDEEAVRREDILTTKEINIVVDLVRTGGTQYTEIKKKKQEPRAYTTMPAPVMADMIARRDADQ